MLETELRKLSIFLDTSSMPFLKKPICNMQTMRKIVRKVTLKTIQNESHIDHTHSKASLHSHFDNF